MCSQQTRPALSAVRYWSLIAVSGTGCSGPVPALPTSPWGLLHRCQGNVSENTSARSLLLSTLTFADVQRTNPSTWNKIPNYFLLWSEGQTRFLRPVKPLRIRPVCSALPSVGLVSFQSCCCISLRLFFSLLSSDSADKEQELHSPVSSFTHI